MSTYEIFSELLKSRGLKVSDVTKATGIAPSSLTDWKKGRTATPKTETLQKIADYFGVSVDYLLGVPSSGQEGYYTNPETAKIAQEIFDDPNLKMLFDAARDLDPADMKMAVDLIKRLKAYNDALSS